METITEKTERFIKATNDYYNGRQTGMTDKEYDELEKEIKESNPSFSKWDFVKYDNEASQDCRHLQKYAAPQFKRMYEDFYDLMKAIDELRDNCPTKEFILCPKWDGCSITAYYHKSQLVTILTRSNEWTGKNQTEKLRNKVPAICHKSKIDFEACVSVEDFGDKCRQKANGLINSKYLQEEVDKYLTLIPHLSFDEKYQFQLNRFDSINTTYELDGKHYPIDGLVLINENDPSEFYIFKFYYTDFGITEVKNIEWRLSPKKAWIPKLILDPVKIAGSNVSRVASGSWEAMQGKGIGAKVKVILSGSTIPQITKVILESHNYGDQVCPICGTKFQIIAGKHYCPNKSCDTYKIPEGFPWDKLDVTNFFKYAVDWNIVPLTRVNDFQFKQASDYFFNTPRERWSPRGLSLSRNNYELLQFFWSNLMSIYSKIDEG